MEVYIPSFRYEESDLERGYTVFKIEVLMNGRKHFVEKRYSEFHALHKKLKKCIKTPEIPSKHVRNWVPKVLEQRRQGLETYLQAVILENEELPKLFLDFLNVRHLPSLPKAESCGSFDETESEESSKLSHQPVLMFLRDPYVLPAASDFPNVVIEGVLHGIFYPHLQPRSSTSGCIPKRTESTDSSSYFYTQVFDSVIHNNQKVETIQVSIDRWTDKMWSVRQWIIQP
ncbi:sorting nexin-24 isoform X1 [Hippopotamus amphibius kiboko]|uniref:sorting nexin-24 isoform X1 n=2 Tax=Hippopotamus amphibius kiboko TaxID=575201 RepID=UPI002597906F|nr:sorting nexin-24 isoform X1 [Hippopotamus amphibius kiboko]